MKRTFLLCSVTGLILVILGLRAHGDPQPIPVPAISPAAIPGVVWPPQDTGTTADSDRPEQPKVVWDLSDPEIKAAYKAWTIAFMNRETEKFREHKKAFAESGSMSVVVFWAAQVLLLWAIIAASIEFVRAQRVRTAAAEIQELRVSLEGLALKTSMHGTFLLVIAMSFYYLFLKFVYPITVVGV